MNLDNGYIPILNLIWCISLIQDTDVSENLYCVTESFLNWRRNQENIETVQETLRKTVKTMHVKITVNIVRMGVKDNHRNRREERGTDKSNIMSYRQRVGQSDYLGGPKRKISNCFVCHTYIVHIVQFVNYYIILVQLYHNLHM